MKFGLKNLLTVICLFFYLFLPAWVMAVPAYPGIIDYTQPDGTVIQIYLKGDERINWGETPDGYTILVTREGEYQYAVQKPDGDLGFSGVAVSNQKSRSSHELELLQNLSKGLFYSQTQVEMFKSVWQTKDGGAQRSFPTMGEPRLLCILMETPDKPFTKTQEEFDALFNQLNYTVGGASGSVRDYYLENSYGQLDLVVDVVGPFMASQEMAHYGSEWAGARELATEAIYLANPVVDFSEYDNSGDGWLDGFYMIFAGYGEEAGGGPNTIWSHAWSINPVNLDGVWISRYACSPELRGNSGTNITRIGVIGHEFGHVLGAPDYYDTDGEGSGGQYQGTGQWDMMASGTWNNGGATPAHHNPYTKTMLYNWAQPFVLENDTSIVMLNSAEYADYFYKINSATPGEYYIMENRRKHGFDLHVPGEGLLIFHVHSQISQAGNAVNAGHPQMMYPVCAGAVTYPNENPMSYGIISSDQTPFPGSTQNTSFTDETIPGTINWAGNPTQKPITNIEFDSNQKIISFDFVNESDPIDFLWWANGILNTNIGFQSGAHFQIAARFTPEDLIFEHDKAITQIHTYVNQPATSAKIKIWQGTEQLALEEVYSQEFDQQAEQWNEIVLADPYVINPEQELWFGVEYDQEPNVYPAGIDNQSMHDGKGNLLRSDLSTHEAWVLLSSYEIAGNWNLRAQLVNADATSTGEPLVLASSGKLSVYPNPASDVLYIQWQEENPEPGDILIYNMHGQLVKQTPAHSGTMSLDVDDLTAGVYLIRFENKQQVFMEKFIKR